MEDKTIRRIYLHDASAVATSGRIVSPFEDLIPAQAALALPVSGGYGSTRVDGFRYKEILCFGSAYTEVAGAGGGEDGPFETLAVAAVEKLNILDVVTCERMVARIASTHPVDGREPSISLLGSRFERLRVGNYFWDELDLAVGAIADCSTWTKLQNALGNGGTREQLKRVAMPAPNGDPVALPDGQHMPNVLGFSLCSAAGKSSNAMEVPARIHLPEFGTVYLGQLFVYQYSRQLLMLRVDLGCPIKGGVQTAGGKSGGNPYPP
jgi:hypothetical protein